MEGARDFLARGACDAILPDIRWTGIRTGMAMLELAAASGVGVSLHNPVGPVLDGISIQVAAALAGFLILERQVRESPLFDAVRGGSQATGRRRALSSTARPGFGPEPDRGGARALQPRKLQPSCQPCRHDRRRKKRMSASLQTSTKTAALRADFTGTARPRHRRQPRHRRRHRPRFRRQRRADRAELLPRKPTRAPAFPMRPNGWLRRCGKAGVDHRRNRRRPHPARRGGGAGRRAPSPNSAASISSCSARRCRSTRISSTRPRPTSPCSCRSIWSPTFSCCSG